MSDRLSQGDVDELLGFAPSRPQAGLLSDAMRIANGRIAELERQVEDVRKLARYHASTAIHLACERNDPDPGWYERARRHFVEAYAAQRARVEAGATEAAQ